MQMFVEFTNEQRFLDIDNVYFSIPELEIEDFRAFGQIYNDARFFEVNALTLAHENSSVRFNGEVDGLNVLKGNLNQQLQDAQFSYLIDRISLAPEMVAELFPATEGYINRNLNGSLEGSGNLDSLTFSNSEFMLGDSFIRFNGNIAHSAVLKKYPLT